MRKVDWGNLVRVCIDGIASMTCYRLSVVPKIKKQRPKKCCLLFCIIHPEHLATTKPPVDFKRVLDTVVKTFYEVRSGVFNSSWKITLCKNIWSRSLSISPYGGKMTDKRTSSFVSCWSKVKKRKLLRKRNPPLNEMWISKLAMLRIYIAIWRSLDLYRGIAQLSLHWETTDVFKQKLALWDTFAQMRDAEMFPSVNNCWC